MVHFHTISYMFSVPNILGTGPVVDCVPNTAKQWGNHPSKWAKSTPTPVQQCMHSLSMCACESSESWKPRANGANTYAYARQPRCRDAEMPTPPPQREAKNGKQATFIAGRAAREVFTVLWERRISQDVNRGSYTMVSSKNKQKSQECNSWLLKVFTSMQGKVVVVVLSEALWGYMSDCVSLSSLHYSSPPTRCPWRHDCCFWWWHCSFAPCRRISRSEATRIRVSTATWPRCPKG